MQTGLGGFGENIFYPPFLKMSDASDMNMRMQLLRYIESRQATGLSSTASLPAVQVLGASGEGAGMFRGDKERYLGGFAGSRAQICN